MSLKDLEIYFKPIRDQVIGIDQNFISPYGEKRIVYADWTASGRLYKPIEDLLSKDIGSFVANTHTTTSFTGSVMTRSYAVARKIIKDHVGANQDDVLIASHSGMTGVVNKFQRILGLRLHEKFIDQLSDSSQKRPVIFVSHMEHHSNQTSWLETLADVKIIPPDENGLMDVESLLAMLDEYRDCPMKIAAITSCSNVTGIFTPYYRVAKIMHEHGGLCFVDFACSAPYIEIDMHPEDEMSRLDAIYFSPHKFLGGPGSSGILVFNRALYKNRIPDDPGGGTVDWTNPWGDHKYVDSIEAREDGGTPGFLQTMKAALCIQLKEQMSVSQMLAREKQQLDLLWPALETIPNLHILAAKHRDRLGVVSFYIDDLHYDLCVRLLNDHYGIQARGGCSCAGTYGHYLLNVSQDQSKHITSKISLGDPSAKPGWVRLSIHPIMTNQELEFIVSSIRDIAEKWRTMAVDYRYHSKTNSYEHKSVDNYEDNMVDRWYNALKSTSDASVF